MISSNQFTWKNNYFFTVPYIEKISGFETLTKKFKFHLAFTILNTLKGFITTGSQIR